jgi:tripartite-type tricarboxylate transporter receptor subunit TctC
MKRNTRCVNAAALALVLSACAFAATDARGQTYPTRTITIVVPSSAGGPGDASAKLIVDKLASILGQSVVVEHVPGAGGTIGMTRVARAAPDGYTLMIHQTGFAIANALYAKLPFDTSKDFVTVGLVNQSHTYFMGRKSLPANNFTELLAWMRGPGKPARLAHPGAGSNGHVQSTMVSKIVAAEVTMVPYRGIAPAVNDLLGEHVDVAGVGAAVATPHAVAGKLKAFASTAAKRSKELPDVPTYGELGHKELERPFWHALFAPAGTPQPILEKLNAALAETLRDAKVQQMYAASVVEPYPEKYWSISAANDYVRAETEYLTKVVRDNNIKVTQ